MVTLQALVEEGLNGLRSYVGPFPSEGRLVVDVAPGTPSLVAALVDLPAVDVPARLSVLDPQGDPVGGDRPGVAVTTRDGKAVAVTVMDPEEGQYTVLLEEAEPLEIRLRLAVLAAAQEDPRDTLIAAAAAVPDVGTPGLPRGVGPLLAPLCVALRPLCGQDAGEAIPPPVVAAADVTGLDPDRILELLEGLPTQADDLRIAQALARAAGL